MYNFLLTIIGGVLYRIRGGVPWLAIGDTKVRLLYALGTGLFTYNLTVNPLLSLLVSITSFVSCIWPNLSQESLPTAKSPYILAGIGAVRGLTVALAWFALYPLLPWIPILLLSFAGALNNGLLYVWKKYAYNFTVGTLIQGYWPLGEFLYGVLQWLAIITITRL